MVASRPIRCMAIDMDVRHALVLLHAALPFSVVSLLSLAPMHALSRVLLLGVNLRVLS